MSLSETIFSFLELSINFFYQPLLFSWGSFFIAIFYHQYLKYKMKKYGETFESDLKLAHQQEDEFAGYLKTYLEATEVIQAPKDSSFTDWDIKGIWKYNNIIDVRTFELKHDRNSWTGSLACEIGRTVNGVYKDTGIAITKADYIVYFFEGNYWVIQSHELRELMQGKHPIKGGDGNRAHIILINKFDFIKKAQNFKLFMND